MDAASIRVSPAASSDTVPPPDSNGTGPAAGPKRPRKVRAACERCRYRRIKCDGQTPACGNCAKAGSACIDVNSRNDGQRVSRGFVEYAVARIAWLEDIIQTQLPHIDLSSSAHLEGAHAGAAGTAGTASWDNGDRPSTRRSADGSTLPASSDVQFLGGPAPMDPPVRENAAAPSPAFPAHALKRLPPDTQAQPNRVSSLEQDTRSIALGLGFLSLNADSRQLHYVGSSSGSLLASMVRAGQSQNDSFDGSRGSSTSPDVDDNPLAGYPGQTNSSQLQFDALRASIASLYAQLRKHLPSRSECDALCQQFFALLQLNHPFLHKPSFDWMVDALYACAVAEPPFLLQHNGWPEAVRPFDCNGEEHLSNGRKLIPVPVHVAAFQLLVVLSIGAALQITRRSYRHDPELFFHSAMSLSNDVFNSVSLSSLQAILLLLVHSLVRPSGQDLWTLLHLATAHSIDLGIHREVGDKLKLSKVAVEMRRRIFYSVYSFDRSISTVQGRPFSIADGFYDVKLPSVSPDDTAFLSGGQQLDGSQGHEFMDYSVHLFKMAQLVSRVKTLFYRLSQPPDGTPWATAFAAAQSQMRDDLDKWVSEVPSVVRFAPAELKPRLAMKLQINYHGTICLLYQPSHAIIEPSDQALLTCYHHAAQRIQLYETLYEGGNLVHSWRTVHDIFLAGTTVMYCAWISPAVRDSVSVPALAGVCRQCSSLLSIGGEWWPVIRKSKLSLERLASHTIEMVAEKLRAAESTTTPPSIAPFQIEPPRPVGAVEPSPPWLPEHIEEALTSVMNHDHDGQLSHVFSTPAHTTFPTGVPVLSEAPQTFDNEFWANLDGYVPFGMSG